MPLRTRYKPSITRWQVFARSFFQVNDLNFKIQKGMKLLGCSRLYYPLNLFDNYQMALVDIFRCLWLHDVEFSSQVEEVVVQV